MLSDWAVGDVEVVLKSKGITNHAYCFRLANRICLRASYSCYNTQIHPCWFRAGLIMPPELAVNLLVNLLLYCNPMVDAL